MEVTTLGLNAQIRGLKDNTAVKKTAVYAEQVFVNETPVDTGILRANWFVSVEYGSTLVHDRKQHRPSHIPDKVAEATGLTIINNVNYVLHANESSYRKMYLENSFSKVRAFVRTLSFTGRR